MSDFSVGEQVYIFHYNSPIMQKAIVEKITPTGFIKAGGALYRPDDHFERGGHRKILKINEETIAQNRQNAEKNFKSNVLYRLETFIRKYDNRQGLTYEQACQLNEILNLGAEFREEDI